MPRQFIDPIGLRIYHNNVEKALNEKANKVYVGDSTPTDSRVDTWFDTTEDSEPQAVSLMSEYSDEDETELTFNDDGPVLTFNNDLEELTFNNNEEELTFNTDGEELTFNSDL